MAIETHFDRMLIEERLKNLRFQRVERGISPGERRVVGYVRQRHCAAWVELAGCADRPRSAIREGQLRAMTARTGLLTSDRELWFVEKRLPQPNLCIGDGIARRHKRDRESARQIPVELSVRSLRCSASRRARNDQRECAADTTLHHRQARRPQL